MTTLASLWLPLLLSTVLVFLASSVIHMVMPWHKDDYPRLPNEDAVLDAMRPLALPPGDYFMPRPASRKDLQSPAFLEKMRRGPVVLMTVMPNGEMGMGRNLAFWFIYCLVVNLFAAYVGGRALPPGAERIEAFRFVTTTAFLGYAAALWQMTIWYRRAVPTTLKATIDGLVYAAIVGAVFAWRWPR